MDRNAASIYIAGLLQGIALVAFPAASTILTDPALFHLSSTEYGSLFIPQSILSILFAFLNPLLRKRFGPQHLLITGIFANLISMTLMALSVIALDSQRLAFWMLITATGCLGIGFGIVVPTINRIAEELYIANSDAAVLTLNALLGVGTALAPVFIACFTTLGFWWGLPAFLALALMALLYVSLSLTLPQEKPTPEHEQNKDAYATALFWVFVSFAFLYGIIETLNGNWVSIFMSKHLNAPIIVQSLALTSFWGMVTFGRIFFAFMSKFLNEEIAFQIAPFLTTVAFILIASLTSGHEYWAVIAFGLTGFGCSILLPLIISFGGKQLKSLAASMPGMIISSYLLGYGVAAFGVGPLEELAHISLRTDYAIGAAISFILGLLSLYIISKQKKNSLSGRS